MSIAFEIELKNEIQFFGCPFKKIRLEKTVKKCLTFLRVHCRVLSGSRPVLVVNYRPAEEMPTDHR